jgi:hypothetical protein
MAIFTLTEIDEQITAYKAALKAVSINKEYTFEGNSYTRADLHQIRKTLEWLDQERTKLQQQNSGFVINSGIVRR